MYKNKALLSMRGEMDISAQNAIKYKKKGSKKRHSKSICVIKSIIIGPKGVGNKRGFWTTRKMILGLSNKVSSELIP